MRCGGDHRIDGRAGETRAAFMVEGYTYIWQFQVRPERESEFLAQYGVDGAWVKLFRRSPGFIETLLLKDRSQPGRYLTIDRWRSEKAHADFRLAFASEYAELDSLGNGMTSDERFIGAFSEARGSSSDA